ncbi:MAG TPA: 50S ribosomal protein L9 [Cytophagales bacterium]|nr:50S ribosomal protein L9 [Cytophagales bacterium]HAA23266.1 50S ribosomal protein L9 [Cytophagales bacterium]HAP61836.1 50S ribosomal protein L9 [Cytophagales bacterium]
MEIILTKDIKGLGYKNDIVDVKPGYGRNYLIPKGMAILANASNKKMKEEEIRQASHKAEKLKADAVELAGKIEALKLTLKTKVGESGKIFGAITTLQLADAINENGYDIDRKQVKIQGDVKTVGEFTAKVELHKEVFAEVTFIVEGE